MKVLLIAGHGAGDPGACGCGYKEADLAREGLALLKSTLAGYNLTVDTYPTNRNAYYDNINGVLQKSFKNYDLVVEIHFNAASAAAKGTEVLHRNQQGLAATLSLGIATHGFVNRGAKFRSDLANMNTCFNQGVRYILIETAFITNRTDMTTYKKVKKNVWNTVGARIAAYYKVSKKTPSPVKKPIGPKASYSATICGYRVYNKPSFSGKIIKNLKQGETVYCYAYKKVGEVEWWKISPTAEQYVPKAGLYPIKKV